MILLTGANGHLGANLLRRLLADGEACACCYGQQRQCERRGTPGRARVRRPARSGFSAGRDRGCRAGLSLRCADFDRRRRRAGDLRQQRSRHPQPAAGGTAQRGPPCRRVRLAECGRPPIRPPHRRGRAVQSVRAPPAVCCVKSRGRARMPEGGGGRARRGDRDLLCDPRAERLQTVAHGPGADRLCQWPAAGVYSRRVRVRCGARHRRRPRACDARGPDRPALYFQQWLHDARFAVRSLWRADWAAEATPPAACADAGGASEAGIEESFSRIFLPGRRQLLTPGAVRLLRMGRRADCSKAKGELGYRPTAIADAVREAHRWLVARGAIAPPPVRGMRQGADARRTRPAVRPPPRLPGGLPTSGTPLSSAATRSG